MAPVGWASAFEYDVFISYARVDNGTVELPEGDPEHGWVAQFHKTLEVALSKRAGRIGAVKIWRDTRMLQGNQYFDRTIENAIHNSAIFLVLTSYGYLASDYCAKELDVFYRKAKADGIGLSEGDESRIFNLLLYNVPRSRWPRECAGT